MTLTLGVLRDASHIYINVLNRICVIYVKVAAVATSSMAYSPTVFTV